MLGGCHFIVSTKPSICTKQWFSINDQKNQLYTSQRCPGLFCREQRQHLKLGKHRSESLLCGLSMRFLHLSYQSWILSKTKLAASLTIWFSSWWISLLLHKFNCLAFTTTAPSNSRHSCLNFHPSPSSDLLGRAKHILRKNKNTKPPELFLWIF